MLNPDDWSGRLGPRDRARQPRGADLRRPRRRDAGVPGGRLRGPRVEDGAAVLTNAGTRAPTIDIALELGGSDARAWPPEIEPGGPSRAARRSRAAPRPLVVGGQRIRLLVGARAPAPRRCPGPAVDQAVGLRAGRRRLPGVARGRAGRAPARRRRPARLGGLRLHARRRSRRSSGRRRSQNATTAARRRRSARIPPSASCAVARRRHATATARAPSSRARPAGTRAAGRAPSRREERDRRRDEDSDLRRRGDRDLGAELMFPRRAITIAPPCSAALPTIATITAATKNCESPSAWPNASSEWTSSSETNAVATVATPSATSAARSSRRPRRRLRSCAAGWRRRLRNVTAM